MALLRAFGIAVIGTIMATQVAGHSHLSINFNNDEDHRDTEGNVDACGVSKTEDGRHTTGRSQPIVVTRGQPLPMKYRVTNGDGAGPLSCDIDTTAAGTSFSLSVPISLNIPGVNGILNTPPDGQSFPYNTNLTVTIPNNLQCTGPSGLCLLRTKNPSNFVSCAYIYPQDAAPTSQGPGVYQQGLGQYGMPQYGRFGPQMQMGNNQFSSFGQQGGRQPANFQMGYGAPGQFGGQSPNFQMGSPGQFGGQSPNFQMGSPAQYGGQSSSFPRNYGSSSRSNGQMRFQQRR